MSTAHMVITQIDEDGGRTVVSDKPHPVNISPMQPHRVLIYTPTVGRGGVHRVVRTLLRGLAQHADPAEWSFSVLGQTFDEIGLKVDYPESWPFEQLDPGPNIPAHPLQFEWLYQQREAFYQHLKRRAGEYDLIYCPSAWWTMRSKEWAIPTPFVTTVPDFAFDHIDMGLLSYNFRYVAKKIAERATFTIFPSNFQREWGESHYGFKMTRTIHYSADFVADNFEATGDEALRVREKYALPEKYVLAFHPMYHKGIMTVLRAMEEVKMGYPLVIAGIGTDQILGDQPIDPHIEQIRDYLKTNGLLHAQHLFILGRIPEEDIAGLYVGASCAVVASESDGDLSGSIFEAMMASCPLIFSDLEVFTERLGTNDRYGLCFPVKDAKALATCINDVITSPQAARQRALEAFGYANSRTVEDVAREYLRVFREVLTQ